MEQPAHTTHKHSRTRGEIDFVAPYSLTDCVSRVRSTKRRVTREDNSGIDSICEQAAPDIYRFTLMRIWRSQKPNRRQTYTAVEMDGYLKSVDDGQGTLVVAQFRVSWLYSLVNFAFAALSIVGGIIWLKQKTGYLFIGIGILLLIYYFYQVSSDKRALRKAIHHVLSDDFL